MTGHGGRETLHLLTESILDLALNQQVCFSVFADWQNAVIGLLIFSVAFGFLAIILSVCGVCTGTLAKKIYYYHSAGEIYFICGECRGRGGAGWDEGR